MKTRSLRALVGLLPAILIVLTLAAPADAAARRCVSAEIADPLILPDGGEHPPGRLTLCVSQHMSPVRSLHEITIDRTTVGLHPSRRGSSEGGAEPPYVMLARTADGRMRLSGFAVPTHGGMDTYALEPDVEVRATVSEVRLAAYRPQRSDPVSGDAR